MTRNFFFLFSIFLASFLAQLQCVPGRGQGGWASPAAQKFIGAAGFRVGFNGAATDPAGPPPSSPAPRAGR